MIGDYFPQLAELTTLSMSVRMVLSVICGGIIGIERGKKGHPAGFRTHILVSVGATIVMLTNQYMFYYLEGTTDMARLGAQVVSGIGFLGAGTIIVTGHNRVKGLTTAAGLWASACIGLATGVGFYEVAILGSIVIIFTSTILHRLDHYVTMYARVFEFYIEFDDTARVRELIRMLESQQLSVTSMSFGEKSKMRRKLAAVIIVVRSPKKRREDELRMVIQGFEGVDYVVSV